MKTDDIAKIRKILKELQRCEVQHIIFNFGSKTITRVEIDEALALLPCETCGGTGKKPRPKGQSHCRLLICKDLKLTCGCCDSYIPQEPCPDCQPKLCICCEEITEENAHLHRNCGK